MKWDNMHYTTQSIDGRQTPFNVIISGREAGKSTYIYFKKCYENWLKNKQPFLLLRRQVVAITDLYLDSIKSTINKFAEEPIQIEYSQASRKEGIVRVYVKNELFFVCIALSVPIERIKSSVILNIRYLIFDEFIINPLFGEKYLNNEVLRFNEVYNTFNRESEKTLICYFLGNPYSLYNPYFEYWKIPISRLEKGKIYTQGKVSVERYKLKPELISYILEKNPSYEFDKDYMDYALDGVAINDVDIPIIKKPDNYYLKFTIFIENQYVAIYRATYDEEYQYYCELGNADRQTYCISFSDILKGNTLITYQDKNKFSHFKTSLSNKRVAFSNISIYYLIEKLYCFL